MPTVLSDPSQTLYVVLAIVVAILAFLWLRNRRNGDLWRLLAGAVCLLGLFLPDRFFESPREEAVRKVGEMATASQEKKWDDLFKHVSESFRYAGPSGNVVDKKALRERVRNLEGESQFKGFSVWDFHRADVRPVDGNKFDMGFRAQLRDYPTSQSWIIATFIKEADGQWRMSSFLRYDFARQDRLPALPVTGLD